MDFLKKLFGWIIALTSILLAIFMGLTAYLDYRANQIRQEKLEFLGTTEEERAVAKKKKEEQEERLRNAQLENLSSPLWADKGKVLNPQQMDPALGIKGLATVGPGKLIYDAKIKEYFTAILEDLEDLVSCGKVYDEKDEVKDNYSNKFLRRNAVFYGSPGTGKSEFPRQLVYEIEAKFASENQKRLNEFQAELNKLEEKLTEEVNKEETEEQIQKIEELNTEIKKTINLISELEQDVLKEDNKLVPVFQIDGFHLQTAGKALNDKGLESHEKLVEIIKALKNEYFGDVNSDKPYIIFVEEADQAQNVMTAGSKGGKPNLLEDWKNFLSTTTDKAGINEGVQDINSVIMIATNNYENLDPGLFRRGRMGKKLNFSWTPELLKEYGESGGNGWPTVDWPNDPAWDFVNSKFRSELRQMSGKMGFALFKDEFSHHAVKIIQSWQNLPSNKRKIKEEELVQLKDENGKEYCYWILHYLYTFWDFYGSEGHVRNFTSAEQIRRYDFGKAARMEENTKAIASLVSTSIVNLGQGITNSLSQIRAEMVANFTEISNLRNEIRQFRQNIQAIDRDIDNFRHEFQRLRDNVNSELSQVSSRVSSAIGSQLGALQSQINALERRVNNLSSSGGYSGGGGSSGNSGSSGGSGGGSSNGSNYNRVTTREKSNEVINYLNSVDRNTIDISHLIRLIRDLVALI